MTARLGLAEELSLVYGKIKEPIAKGNPLGLIDDLSERCEWLARSAELVAEAQYHLDVARGIASETVDAKLSWSIAKEIIASKTADNARLLRLADRLHATISNQMKAIITVISFEKESQRQSQRNP